MASENITLYIKGDRNVEVTEQDVFLKDIVSMECSDKKFLPKLQTVKILKLHETENSGMWSLYWKSLPVSMLRTLK